VVTSCWTDCRVGAQASGQAGSQSSSQAGNQGARGTGKAGKDVLSEIDNMLQGLTDELDAMLEFEMDE